MEPKKELSFDESVAQVMQTLPSPIRRYLGQGKYSVVANNLMTKYGLHVDQGGILEREIMLLLMGIENPDEFTQALVEEAKLDQQTINNIVKDVNEQIFVPLREEMQKGPAPQAPAKPAAPASSETSQGTAREKVMPLNTVIIPANPQMPSHQAQTFASMLKYSPPQKYFNLQNKIPPPATTKPMDSSKLLEDHEEPHIEFGKTVPPPANLPGAMPPPLPLVKPYSSDPYREPIDEK